MRRPYWIPYRAGTYQFPPLEQALNHPDGLLAVGGDLSVERLIVAYRQGIFPWYSEEQPILWWSPRQRLVLFPEHLKVSRSLRKTLRTHDFVITMDQNFRGVVEACALPRHNQQGTWITQDIIEAYCQLHQRHLAHSVETWLHGKLVGGLYGIALGKVFFGESMFSSVSEASKVAFVKFVRQLQQWNYELIDCQVKTEHLMSLGAFEIPRQKFRALLDRLCDLPGHEGHWQFEKTDVYD